MLRKHDKNIPMVIMEHGPYSRWPWLSPSALLSRHWISMRPLKEGPTSKLSYLLYGHNAKTLSNCAEYLLLLRLSNSFFWRNPFCYPQNYQVKNVIHKHWNPSKKFVVLLFPNRPKNRKRPELAKNGSAPKESSSKPLPKPLGIRANTKEPHTFEGSSKWHDRNHI